MSEMTVKVVPDLSAVVDALREFRLLFSHLGFVLDGSILRLTSEHDLPEDDPDAAAAALWHVNRLTRLGFKLTVWQNTDDPLWNVRIESLPDEDHDTYYTACGTSFTEAVFAADRWTDFLRTGVS